MSVIIVVKPSSLIAVDLIIGCIEIKNQLLWWLIKGLNKLFYKNLVNSTNNIKSLKSLKSLKSFTVLSYEIFRLVRDESSEEAIPFPRGNVESSKTCTKFPITPA